MFALEAGQKFERYRILRKLGSGLSGTSYEAEDSLLQRKVTLKLIHPWAPLPDAARRQFFREMHGISSLTHPYIAAILDYGEADGQLYIARRYVSSGSLLSSRSREWFRPPFTRSDAFLYTHQLAQALYYIHDRDHFHGSLTLSNILVVRGPNLDNEPDFAPFLLADIGITHFARRFGQPGQTERLQDTPLPVTTAPEQLGKHVTKASDQYALAVLLYIWLTGQPPFLGSPEEITQLKLSETLPSLTASNPDMTEEQERILHRALHVYPDERYPSVLAFTEALLATLTLSTAMFSPSTDIQEPEPLPPQPNSPRPQTEPDVPQPLPAPEEPVPQPEPAPLPRPEQTPQLPPEAPPPMGPDIAQPLPDPAPLRPTEPVPPKETQPSATTAYLDVFVPYVQESHKVFLSTDETSLGRAGSSDILLDQDSTTSRHHALIKQEGERYVIYDLRSASGVFVNGEHIPVEIAHPLTDGDQIEIGAYRLHFHAQGLSSATNENDKMYAVPRSSL